MAGGRRILLSVAAAVMLAGAAWWAWQVNGDRRVPVIIYLVDTLRADRLGTYRYFDRETSPVIDALARESVVFEQAYAPAPWTPPSVASLMTSTYLCEHGVLSERASDEVTENELDPETEEKLRSLGYL